MERNERIRYFEKLFDRVNTLNDEIERGLRELAELSAELQAYYSAEWREDFEADEAGLIPDYVKRGVLSEDGLWDALERAGELLRAHGAEEPEEACEEA